MLKSACSPLAELASLHRSPCQRTFRPFQPSASRTLSSRCQMRKSWLRSARLVVQARHRLQNAMGVARLVAPQTRIPRPPQPTPHRAARQHPASTPHRASSLSWLHSHQGQVRFLHSHLDIRLRTFAYLAFPLATQSQFPLHPQDRHGVGQTRRMMKLRPGKIQARRLSVPERACGNLNASVLLRNQRCPFHFQLRRGADSLRW